MLKQKISGLFIAMALLLLFGSTVFPHHHHGSLICFNMKCVETCHHHLEGEAEEEGLEAHHHNHSSDECVIHLPFLLAEQSKFTVDSQLDSHPLFAMAAFVVPVQLQVEPPFAIPHGTFAELSVPLPTAVLLSANGRRGPPVA